MAQRHSLRRALGSATILSFLLAAAPAAAGQDAPSAPLKLASGRVSIEGTSNIHAYAAATTSVRLTRVQLASGVLGPELWDNVVKPGALEAFEIAIPAATLTSPKEGLDKNMHKALKVVEHAEITFRLLRIESGANGALKGVGVLKIAGVEREVALDLKTRRTDDGLAVGGAVPILMTDYGIAPPKAMMGMLKTDPKVTVRFDIVLAVPLT
jgi:hypothetical protein